MDYETRLFAAYIVAGITASVGQGFPFQALYFLLVVIYGIPDDASFMALTVLHAVIIFYSGLARGAARS